MSALVPGIAMLRSSLDSYIMGLDDQNQIPMLFSTLPATPTGSTHAICVCKEVVLLSVMIRGLNKILGRGRLKTYCCG